MADLKKILHDFSFLGTDIRVMLRAGEPWFVAADAAKALSVDRHRDLLKKLDPDEKGSDAIATPGGPQKVSLISESGLYEFIFASRKKVAAEFKRWLRKEVLPAIRQTGSYDKGWYQNRSKAADRSKFMCESIDRNRTDQGKETKAHHYSTYHLLINSLVTGHRGALDRDTLSAAQLELMEKLQHEAGIANLRSRTYAETKALLSDLAATFWSSAEPDTSKLEESSDAA